MHDHDSMPGMRPGSRRLCKPRSSVAMRTIAGVVFAALEAHAQVASVPPSPTVRTLHGQITASGHEPIRGAIVQLRNDRSETLVTYITGNNGLYIFQRLDGNTDYEVWVMFRGHRTRTHSISKFDSHMDKIINFRVSTY